MEAVEEVKAHLDVVDIVGEYVQLKPAGSGSFKACCPFHQEKTPSFYANRQRQSWHCFGCDKGGDLISFVMEIEGMEFRDALEHLAKKAGVQLPSFNPETAGKRKRLEEINDLASRFFRAQLLQSPAAAHAREYASKRLIDSFVGDLFRIGYAPDSWDALKTALNGKGITDQELIDAGLCSRKQDGSGVYDRFRSRLMFSIQDIHGNVVGFTGRSLDPNVKEAKYVNSPETFIYKKSSVLYGLDKAKGEIKSKNLCVIVEGNMDCLSSHRVNVANVVASSGTALTAEQLKLISRFTKNLAIAFDGDSAGLQATIRGLDLAREQDFSIRIISIPLELGKDPDDLIAKDPELWKQAIRDAVDIIEWMFKMAFRGKNLGNPEDKKAIASAILPEIQRIADPIVRDHWIKKLSNAIDTSTDALSVALKRSQIKERAYPIKATGEAGQQPEKQTPDRKQELLERTFTILLLQPDFLPHITPVFVSMLDSVYHSLYTHVKNGYHPLRSQTADISPDTPYTAPDQSIERLVSYLAIRADRDYPQQKQEILLAELQSSISAYIELLRTEKRKHIEQEMREAEHSGDTERVLELAKRFQELQD